MSCDQKHVHIIHKPNRILSEKFGLLRSYYDVAILFIGVFIEESSLKNHTSELDWTITRKCFLL